ncbi:MAG: translation initiation factor eIF-1A [Candidatus Bathyarchaeia archaeon]
MGKKKILSEGNHRNIVYPSENDVIGIVKKMLGYDRAQVKCQDGFTRICRIRGKMKKRNWIREGDVVLVSPWEFQSEERGEIFWRYTNSQVDELKRKRLV